MLNVLNLLRCKPPAQFRHFVPVFLFACVGNFCCSNFLLEIANEFVETNRFDVGSKVREYSVCRWFHYSPFCRCLLKGNFTAVNVRTVSMADQTVFYVMGMTIFWSFSQKVQPCANSWSWKTVLTTIQVLCPVGQSITYVGGFPCTSFILFIRLKLSLHRELLLSAWLNSIVMWYPISLPSFNLVVPHLPSSTSGQRTMYRFREQKINKQRWKERAILHFLWNTRSCHTSYERWF